MEQTKNIVFFLSDEDQTGNFEEDDEIHRGAGNRDKFVKTQKIELSKKGVRESDMILDSGVPTNSIIINPNLTQKMPRFLPSTVDSEVKSGMTGGDQWSQKNGGNFSKTLSKTALLNKIKAALGKQ